MSNKLFKVNKLSFSYSDNILIDNLSFSLESRSITAFLCPNNGGKTSLIKLLSGIIYASDASISIMSIPLKRDTYYDYSVRISTILEDIDEQFICDSVYDELSYPLINLGYSTDKISKIIKSVSNTLNIKNILNSNILKLSRFSKIKVLIAASIVHMPKLLLVDDILRFCNDSERKDILKIFNDINGKYGISVFYTTSDINDIIDIDRVIVFNNGHIEMDGSYKEIILKDNELSKMGFKIPLMIDLSRKLQFYKLIDDNIYYDPDVVVDLLWK